MEYTGHLARNVGETKSTGRPRRGARSTTTTTPPPNPLTQPNRERVAKDQKIHEVEEEEQLGCLQIIIRRIRRTWRSEPLPPDSLASSSNVKPSQLSPSGRQSFVVSDGSTIFETLLNSIGETQVNKTSDEMQEEWECLEGSVVDGMDINYDFIMFKDKQQRIEAAKKKAKLEAWNNRQPIQRSDACAMCSAKLQWKSCSGHNNIGTTVSGGQVSRFKDCLKNPERVIDGHRVPICKECKIVKVGSTSSACADPNNARPECTACPGRVTIDPKTRSSLRKYSKTYHCQSRIRFGECTNK